MRSGLMVAAVLAVSATGAPAQNASATLDKAVRAYANVRTLRASFTQTITNPLLGQTVNSAGEVLQRRPAHVALRFSDPEGDRIIADGRYVWFYLPSSAPGQVIRTQVSKDGNGSPDLTAQFLSSPATRYTVTDLGNSDVHGRRARMLSLVPKAGVDAPFTKAVIWVDNADGLIRQFEMTEPSEIVRRVTLRNLTINGAVPASAFRFTPPKGAQILEQ